MGQTFVCKQTIIMDISGVFLFNSWHSHKLFSVAKFAIHIFLKLIQLFKCCIPILYLIPGSILCGCNPYNFKPYRAFQFYFLPLAQFVVAAILLNLPFLKYFGSIVVATILLNLYEIFSVAFQFFYTYLDSLWLQSFFN